MEKSKASEESRTVMTELVLPNDGNILGNLLGGRLLHWIDIAGAMAASRHSGGLVATIQMDPVIFKRPIRVGGIVELTSYVTWTGKTSLETAVEVYAEDAGERYFVSKVYVVFVALGEGGAKRATPPLAVSAGHGREEWAAAEKRRSARF